jgi:hypothetical protein
VVIPGPKRDAAGQLWDGVVLVVGTDAAGERKAGGRTATCCVASVAQGGRLMESHIGSEISSRN